jgi:hypothetical protein
VANASWQHALQGALLLSIIVGALIAFRPKKRNRRVKRKEWPVADYSHQYRAKREWLGERFLLAKPINRRAS